MKTFIKMGTLVLIVALAVSLFTVPAVAQAEPADPLNYFLSYDKNQNKLQFTVSNLKYYPINLSFNSGKTFDLEIRQYGQKIWRYSDGRFYAPALRNEKLSPGYAKSYQVELPRLKKGLYEVLAYFEGGTSRGKVVAKLSLNIKDNASYNERGLNYALDYASDEKEISFTVSNNSYWPIQLTYPTGKKFDLLLLNNKGEKVWRYSDDRKFTQALQREWLYPWHNLIFKAKLPELRPGNYTVLASFHAYGINNVVSSSEITIENKEKYPGLEYSAWYSGGSQPRIIFAVKNLTNRNITVTFPTGQKYDVVVKGNNGYQWRFSADKLFGKYAHSETIKSGVNRFNYLYLPQLPHGKYTANVYYLGISSSNPVATTSFTVN